MSETTISVTTDDSAQRNSNVPWDEERLKIIQAALTGLKYGTVTLIVHEGRIVQVDRTEKTRIGLS